MHCQYQILFLQDLNDENHIKLVHQLIHNKHIYDQKIQQELFLLYAVSQLQPILYDLLLHLNNHKIELLRLLNDLFEFLSNYRNHTSITKKFFRFYWVLLKSLLIYQIFGLLNLMLLA